MLVEADCDGTQLALHLVIRVWSDRLLLNQAAGLRRHVAEVDTTKENLPEVIIEHSHLADAVAVPN